jgi:GNAT superfamily N-acetyltransferase
VVALRSPGPGELGWIVQRHGRLYDREYGWGVAFEALVAGVVKDFAEQRMEWPDRVAGWIADLDGEPAGSVLCMRDDDETARLRLLLVEPFARGHGIGRALVEECISFAREAGYRDLVLWTNEPLKHARPIYDRLGFVLDREFTHSRFGVEMLGQDLRLPLSA